MLVKDFKELKLPKEFINSLSIVACQNCGEALEINETLTRLSCLNPSCRGKVANKVYNLLNEIGVKSISEKECLNFVINFDLDNHYAILGYEPDADGVFCSSFDLEASKKLFDLINEKKSMTLSKYIELSYIDELKATAKYLFPNYTSLVNFYEDLESRGVPFIVSLLGEHFLLEDSEGNPGTPVSAYKLTQVLLDNKDFLMEYTHAITMQENVTRIFTINEDVKEDILKHIDNKELLNRLEFTDTVTKNCNYVVYSDSMSLAQLRLLSAIEEAEKLEIPVMSVSECLTSLLVVDEDAI